MKNWIKSIWAKVTGSDAAKAVIGKYIGMAGDIATGAYPGDLDDKMWKSLKKRLKTKYPILFGQLNILSEEEEKLLALAAATELVQMDTPYLSTTEARLAVQAAYSDMRDESLKE